MRVALPRAISIGGRQSLHCVCQQDRQHEGYRIPARQRGGKTRPYSFTPPPPLIPSQVTCRAANLLVGSLRRHRIENLFRFDFLFVRTLNLMTLRIMRTRCLSQYIARGQLDPTRDDVLAQLKALPASQHPVPPLEFFKQRVAQAALRDTKKFGQQTTS